MSHFEESPFKLIIKSREFSEVGISELVVIPHPCHRHTHADFDQWLPLGTEGVTAAQRPADGGGHSLVSTAACRLKTTVSIFLSRRLNETVNQDLW